MEKINKQYSSGQPGAIQRYGSAREYVWYSPIADELFCLGEGPQQGYEARPHDVVINGVTLLMEVFYVGEL